MEIEKLINNRIASFLKEHTHIGVRYDDSSSKKGKKEALKVLIKVPNISPTWDNVIIH